MRRAVKRLRQGHALSVAVARHISHQIVGVRYGVASGRAVQRRALPFLDRSPHRIVALKGGRIAGENASTKWPTVFVAGGPSGMGVS